MLNSCYCTPQGACKICLLTAGWHSLQEHAEKERVPLGIIGVVFENYKYLENITQVSYPKYGIAYLRIVACYPVDKNDVIVLEDSIQRHTMVHDLAIALMNGRAVGIYGDTTLLSDELSPRFVKHLVKAETGE